MEIGLSNNNNLKIQEESPQKRKQCEVQNNENAEPQTLSATVQRAHGGGRRAINAYIRKEETF